jgi:hypothetical protein
MAVTIPIGAAISIGIPDAMAIPIDKGRATRNTTSEANKSSFQDFLNDSA